MTTTAAELLVKVGADTAEAQRKLNSMSKDFDALRAGASKMAIGLTAAVAAAGAATVAFAAKAVAAGSDLAESQNKVQVVFGQSAASIQQWANSAAQNLAMTQQQALESAGTFGNLFNSMGIAEQNAAAMSRQLVQLAADLASFNNIGVDTALEKLQSGLVGETEPLRALGVNLSAATAEAKALELGLAATAQQLTAADMAQARYALILEQTKTAQGDLARTSDGWANQMRILQATIGTLTAEIGTKLLPVLTPLLQQVADFVQNSGPALVATIGNIVTSFQSMVTVIGQIDLSAVNAQFAGLQQAINVDFWSQVFGFIGQQIALTIVNFQQLGFWVTSIGEQFAAFGDFIKGDTSWSEYRARMQELQVEYDNAQAAFQETYDEINSKDWGGAIAGLNAVSEANAEATDWWQRHREGLNQFGDDVAVVADVAFSMADTWAQAYEAIQNITTTSMDASRNKVLETFNGMAQDYARHAQTIADLEQRKGEMVAYLESVYQQQAAALQAAGQTAQLADLTRAHQAKIKAVLASYNSQIALEKTGQTVLLSNAKKYYLTTLSIMSRALIAQVSTVKANMTALVRMLVSGYGSAAAAAMAFNQIKAGVMDMAAISAAIADVQAAFSAIEGAGISAITEASDAFKDWKADIGDVADGIGDVGDKLDSVGSGASSKLVDPLRAAAQVVEGIGQMIQRAIDAFNTLAKWGGPDAGWVEKFDLLAEALITMVRKWAAAVNQIMPLLEEKKRNQIMQFAEMVRAVMSALQSAITVLGAIEQYEGVFAVSAESLANIVAFVHEIVDRFEEMGRAFKDEALAHLKLFSETALQVVKLIGDALVVFTMLQEITDFSTITRTLLDQIVSLVHYLVNAVSEIADLFTTTILEETKRFTEGAGAVMKLIGDAVGSLMKLKEYDKDFSLADAGAQKLVDQIGAFVRKLVRLSGTFDEDLLADAKKFADVAGPVVKLIGDAIGSLMKLKDYDKNFSLANAGAQKLVDQIGAFVRKLVRLSGTFDEDLLADAKKFADVAGPVVKLIGDAIGSLMKFKDYDKNFSLHDAGAQKLIDQIAAFVRKLARLGQSMSGDALAAAKQFAATAGPVVEVIGNAIESLMKFKNYDKNFNLHDAGAGKLVAQIGSFVRQLARLGQQIGQPAMTAAEAFAEAAGKVVATISDALDLLVKIKTYVGPTANALLAFERDVEDMLLRFSRWVVFVIQPIASGIDSEAMQAMQEMVAGLQAALEVLNGLVDYVSPSSAAITAFMDGVEQLALDFIEWAQTNGPQLFKEIPPEFLAAFRDVFEGLGAAVDVLTALVDFVAPSVMAVLQFEEGYQRLFMDWLTWTQNNLTTMKTDVLVAIAGVFTDVMGGLRTAVDVLTALKDFVPPTVMAVLMFEEGYQRLFQDWVTWATGTFEDLNVELVAAIASVFGDVFTGIGAAVETLSALSDYVSPSITAVMAFEADYQRLFTGFVNWVETTFTDISSDLVIAMAGAASSLFQGLGAAATTLAQITGYIGPTDATIALFEQDYQRIATEFRTWAESSWTEETAAITTAVGNAVNALFTGLGTAATTLGLIRTYVPASQRAIDNFIADMTEVMGRILAWVQTEFGPDAQAIMTGFGNTAQTLFTAIGTALNVLQGIADYTVPNSQFIRSLQRFNDNMYTAITSWQIWLANTFTPATTALVQQFHTLMAGIVADMTAALQLLMDIDQANLPTADELEAFLQAIANLFQGTIDIFGTVVSTIDVLVQNMGVTMASMFAQVEESVAIFQNNIIDVLANLFNGVAMQMWAWGDYAAGMFMSGLLRGMRNVNSQNAVITAMRDLAAALEAELRAAWGLHSPSQVAMGIGEQFVAGLALGLRDLAGIPNMIQQQLAMDGVMLGADVRYSTAPRHDYLTVEFRGAYQTGMGIAEEQRITMAITNELRRQGLALATR